ncbi:MAG: hypothetical protein HY741_15355 [Chloroflexi bacterium]|nr:hypothetical protein [Chloroflexota bacterium]
MVLTFPYYDPSGKYNQALQRQLATLKSSFDGICLSVAPPTSEDNATFIQHLEEQGCFVSHNASGTSHAHHSREALRLAAEHAPTRQPIFFGFMERILFALETEWRTSFLQDLQAYQANEFVVFERSSEAWDTHPANFREIENMLSRMAEFMHGEFLDLMPCAFILSYATANVILNQSVSASTDVWGEWVLLAIKNHVPTTRPKVNWLAWKEAYWEGIEPNELKRQREASQGETIKRIKMNVPAMLMLTEERFKQLQTESA